jgi:hypothetical protein
MMLWNKNSAKVNNHANKMARKMSRSIGTEVGEGAEKERREVRVK